MVNVLGTTERLASEWLQRAGLPTNEPVRPELLVRRLLGPGSVIRPPGIQRSYGALLQVHGKPRIALSDKTPQARRPFIVVHELAHWILDQSGEPNTEDNANKLAAALLCPGPAIERAEGLELAEAAEAFGVSQTLYALRHAEYRAEPRAVTTRSHVFVRGALNISEVERLRKTRITDWPGRFVAYLP